MSSTTISGGVDLQGESITIGGDVVGRDKIVNPTIYGAVINAPREAVIKPVRPGRSRPRPAGFSIAQANSHREASSRRQAGRHLRSDGRVSALLRQAAIGTAAHARLMA
jgi:hypothetical protein